jgi:MFS family permease
LILSNTKPPLLTPVLRWFLLGMVLANISSAMLFTLLPVYLTELGASVGQVGLVFTLAALVPLALQIFGGWLSDTIGRLRTIAIGSLTASLGYILFPLAGSWEWVILALSLEYVSGALVGPTFGAFIADQSSEASRGRVFGFSKGIFMIVSIIGPLLGGYLAYNLGFRVMLSTAAVLYILATALRVWMVGARRFKAAPPEVRLTLASFRSSLGSMIGLVTSGGILTWILLTDGIRDISFRLSTDLQPLYLSEIGGQTVAQIGQLEAVFGVAMMGMTFLSGGLSDRFGERRMIAAGFSVQALAFAILLISKGFGGYAAAWVVFGLGVGGMAPAYDSLISKVVPENQRGLAYGLFWTSLGVISLPAPWLGAQLWERVGPWFPFALTGAASLLTALPAWFKFRLEAR